MDINKIKEDFAIKPTESVKTKFIDNLNAVKVELIDYPDQERIKKVFVNFSTASWYEDYYETASKKDVDAAIKDLLSGNMLAQGLEACRFTFKVSGLSLHGSHALVRNRIGICYMQQSQAVQPYTNSDVLVPRAFTKHYNMLERYKIWVIEGKTLYQDLLDTGDVSILDARMCLPKTIPVWMYVSCNLNTLLQLYSKRSDTQEEHPEMNIMAEQMKDLVVEKFPYMKSYFVSGCDNGRCLHTKPGYKANCIFKRDDKHKVKKDNWTLHDKTKKELMLDCEEYTE